MHVHFWVTDIVLRTTEHTLTDEIILIIVFGLIARNARLIVDKLTFFTFWLFVGGLFQFSFLSTRLIAAQRSASGKVLVFIDDLRVQIVSEGIAGE